MQFYSKKRRPATINIVPLIDILTMIVIFFVVTTTFKKADTVLKIKLPESTTAEKEKTDKPSEPTILYASKDEHLFFGKDEVKIKDLAAEFRRRKAASPAAVFALKADTGVPLGFFVKVLDASKDAGVGNLSMYTEDVKPESANTGNVTAPIQPTQPIQP